jgi:hypothetical protein
MYRACRRHRKENEFYRFMVKTPEEKSVGKSIT